MRKFYKSIHFNRLLYISYNGKFNVKRERGREGERERGRKGGREGGKLKNNKRVTLCLKVLTTDSFADSINGSFCLTLLNGHDALVDV